jgi:hypothetical protein
MNAVFRIVRWVLGQLWEKINLPAIYRELRALGKKHGKRFFWAALIWELIEDVLFPYLSWLAGMPELIPLFLVLHFEPIVYPVFFWAFRTYDRYKDREPWEPDRSAQSSHWRSAVKVGVYKVASLGWFTAVFLAWHATPKMLVLYAVLMALFGFIHERIWHDSNYGILPNDVVEVRRITMKALTYRIVSTMIFYPFLRATLGTVPWKLLLLCQGVGLVLYIVLESVWARSMWGCSPVSQPKTEEVPC